MTSASRHPGPPRDPVKARLLRLYAALLQRFGRQRWWPGRTPYEIAVGAVLAQHTAWTNASRAVTALRRRRLLRAQRVVRLPEAALAEVIRASGTYRLKARRLLSFTHWLLDRFGGRWSAIRLAPLRSVREDLMEVPGMGPETVDAILLYAADRPIFVADAYVRRVLARHRLLPARATYEEARRFIEAHLPSDPALFNEFHALLVAVGKTHCRAIPRCRGCPLAFDDHEVGGGRGRPLQTSPFARGVTTDRPLQT